MSTELEGGLRGEPTLFELLGKDSSLMPKKGSLDESFLLAYCAARKEYSPSNRKPLIKVGEEYKKRDPDIFARLSDQIQKIREGIKTDCSVDPYRISWALPGEITPGEAYQWRTVLRPILGENRWGS